LLTKDRIDRLTSLNFAWRSPGTSHSAPTTKPRASFTSIDAGNSASLQEDYPGLGVLEPESVTRSVKAQMLRKPFGGVKVDTNSEVVLANTSLDNMSHRRDERLTPLSPVDESRLGPKPSGKMEANSTSESKQLSNMTETGLGPELPRQPSQTKKSTASPNEKCLPPSNALSERRSRTSTKSETEREQPVPSTSTAQTSLLLFPAFFVPQVSHHLRATIHDASFSKAPRIVYVTVPKARSFSPPGSVTTLSQPSGAERRTEQVLLPYHLSWHPNSMTQLAP
jgi:hypothetical protein